MLALQENDCVLITGGSGFLGKRMKAYLEDANIATVTFSSRDLDLRNAEETRQYFQNARPTCVIHCAVEGGGIGWMKDHPVESGLNNVRINSNVLEAAFLCGAKSFVGVSSACIYPKEGAIPYKETAVWGGYPEPFNGPYALSKRMMMDLGRAYAKQHQFHCVFPILANLYGPGDHLSPERAHVVADLMLRAMGKPSEFVVWGTGIAQREFLYIDDAVEGILACLTAKPGDFINIGTGISTSIKDLAAMIIQALNVDIPIVFDPSKPDGQLQKVLSIQKAQTELGWSPKVDLFDGICRTLHWYSGIVQ